MIYTSKMLAERFNVTTLKPYETDLSKPVRVQGRKTYKEAKAVSISVTENRKIGFTAVIHLLVEGRYRKINWENLTSEENERVQNALNL